NDAATGDKFGRGGILVPGSFPALRELGNGVNGKYKRTNIERSNISCRKSTRLQNRVVEFCGSLALCVYRLAGRTNVGDLVAAAGCNYGFLQQTKIRQPSVGSGSGRRNRTQSF